MPKKLKPKKTAWLGIALEPKDRTLVDTAAKSLELPPSVWGRAILLREARKIIGEAKVAK